MLKNSVLCSKFPVRTIPLDFRYYHEDHDYTESLHIGVLIHKIMDLNKGRENPMKAEQIELQISMFADFQKRLSSKIAIIDSTEKFHCVQNRVLFQDGIN